MEDVALVAHARDRKRDWGALQPLLHRAAAHGAAFTTAYPTVVAAITEYFQHDHTVDDLFRDCLGVIIEGATKSSSNPDRSSPSAHHT